MREVEHVGQAEHQREAGGDQEVQRGQAEPGQRQQHDRWTSAVHLRRADAEQRPGQLGLAEQLAARRRSRPPGRRPARPRRAASRRTTARFCSTSSTGTASATRPSTSATSVTTFGARPLVGSSTSSSRLSVEQHPADREHLLLPAGQRAGPLPRAPRQLREQRVHPVVVRRRRRALGQPQVLRHGQPGEDAPVLGHVRRARRGPAGRSARRSASAPPKRTEPATYPPRGVRPRIARSVVVLPTPLRPSSDGDAGRRHVEGDALQDVQPGDAHRQVASTRRGRRRSQRLPQVGLLHGRVRPSPSSGVSQASSAPWCMTATRSARSSTTSMWCSTMSTRPAAVRGQRRGSPRPASGTSSALTPAIGSSSSITGRLAGEQQRDLQLALLAVGQRAGQARPRGRRGRPGRAPRPPRAATARSADARRHSAHRAAAMRLHGQPDVLPHASASRTPTRTGRCGPARAGPAGAAASPVMSRPPSSDRAGGRPAQPGDRG